MALAGLLIAGLLSFLFGVLVIIFPKFLRFAVGLYFILAGLFLIISSLL